MKFPKMHEIRFLTGEVFLRAFKKYGLFQEILELSRASAELSRVASEILLGTRGKTKEAELLARMADVHIFLAAVETALRAQNDVRTAIDARLAEFTDKALRP